MQDMVVFLKTGEVIRAKVVIKTHCVRTPTITVFISNRHRARYFKTYMIEKIMSQAAVDAH